MAYVDRTNLFFQENVYPTIRNTAVFPVSLAFDATSSMPATALLCPIVLPITIATTSFALCLAAVAVIVHGLSLIVAGIIDCYSNTNKDEAAAEPAAAQQQQHNDDDDNDDTARDNLEPK